MEPSISGIQCIPRDILSKHILGYIESGNFLFLALASKELRRAYLVQFETPRTYLSQAIETEAKLDLVLDD